MRPIPPSAAQEALAACALLLLGMVNVRLAEAGLAALPSAPVSGGAVVNAWEGLAASLAMAADHAELLAGHARGVMEEPPQAA